MALVSGGKDSVMAGMMAASYGHRVVALGNLLPAQHDVEELDSHCFQTVGHRAVEAYGELTGLPLFRRRIEGASRHTELAYEVGDASGATDGDEVEDLRALLAGVVAAMPSVKAVTSGAILSDYQRLRVEAVCADLGLVSLAYLWRQPQGTMLEIMCAARVDAVLVKVAAMGLNPRRDLGRSLADMRPTLYKIEREYGSHCCGEGGEFETLTLDCPLFRRGRLHITTPAGCGGGGGGGDRAASSGEAPKVVVTSPDPFAPSGHLAVEHYAVELKPGGGEMEAGEVIDVKGPPPPPRRRRRQHQHRDTTMEADTTAAAAARADGVVVGEVDVRETRGAALCTISASTPAAATASTTSNTPAGAAAAAAASTEAALLAVEDRLVSSGRGWSDVSLVHLYVADMSHFAAVNEAYVGVVPTLRPPARACVQLPLPAGVPAALDVTAAAPPPSGVVSGSARRSLHVQSLSCWAPACIGPYGQAVAHLGLVHLAGCIGMDPATLDLVGSDATSATAADRAEARRSWRSAAAVARVMGCPLGRDTLAATVYASSDAGSGARRASDEAFEEILAGDGWQDEVDVPGGPHAAAAGVPPGTRHDLTEPARHALGSSGGGVDDVNDYGDAARDRGLGVGGDGSGVGPAVPWPWSWRPLVTHVTVSGLPKGARVEVQPLLLDGDGPGATAHADATAAEGGDAASCERWDGDVEASRAAVEERGNDVLVHGEVRGCWRSLSRAGRFCRVHAAVSSGGDTSSEGAAAAVEAAAAALHAAGMSWGHVGVLRAYAASGAGEAVRRRLDTAVQEAARGGASPSPRMLRCVVVPVLAASFGDVHDAGLVLEVTAVA